ncbi:putative glucan 1,3-beta-glucosidase [Fusarium circinatum]|uniref:Putative glucan 1,3-beta-glucosidase n=1 Tax=Fusarium circinatum TaxID=48490 RepID=A0A8H5X7P7_FUSCI|nr:putative glucan 1,3-beta-glucosidase [Fusarium circinatum]
MTILDAKAYGAKGDGKTDGSAGLWDTHTRADGAAGTDPTVKDCPNSENTDDIDRFPEACQNALTALVRCDNYTDEWTIPSYHGVLPRDVDVESVCDEGCARSISDWRLAVDTYCGNATWHDGAAAGVLGFFVSQGIDETCQTYKKTGKYCNDIIYNFTLSESIDKMPTN